MSRAASAPASVRRTGTVGGPRQPRGKSQDYDQLLLRDLADLKLDDTEQAAEEENDGSGFLAPPDGWHLPATQTDAAPAYFVRVQNVVCTCATDADFTPALAAHLCHGRYDSRVFPAATIPMSWPFSTVSVFATGNLVISGARDAMQGLAAGLVFLRKMSQHTRKVYKLFNFRVENVVGSAAVGACIDLERLQQEHALDAVFNPEVFAGLSYRPREREEVPVFRNGRPVVGVFRKGKLVICGALTPEHLMATFLFMHEFLQPYMLRD